MRIGTPCSFKRWAISHIRLIGSPALSLNQLTESLGQLLDENRAGEIGVEPRIGFLQAGNLMWIETTAITKKPGLRYESGEVPMVLPIDSNDEPNKHLDT